MANKIIWAGEEPSQYNEEIVGGKGLNLLRLSQFAKKTGLFNVPNFFIIPPGRVKSYTSNPNSIYEVIVTFKDDEIKNAFERLKKPVAVRSSYSLEDGVNASFAGMFRSYLNQENYEQLTGSAGSVYHSVNSDDVKKYAERLGIKMTGDMAIIVQEQVTDFLEKGIIQLEKNGVIRESVDKKGKTFSSMIRYIDLWDSKLESWKPTKSSKSVDALTEDELEYLHYCAYKATTELGLEPVVQVEFLMGAGKVPDFVQIRKLPKIQAHSAYLNLDIPKGTAFLESEICNGVAGELTLPTYVTTSQAGLLKILVSSGQQILGFKERDKRADIFNRKSNLVTNEDFQRFTKLYEWDRLGGDHEKIINLYNEAWEYGNNLFSEYVLVCDKLDETCIGMNSLTPNKKAIVTCLEAKRTSHAMTVARDLGIMAMGVEGDINDMNYFYNKVETGDLIHMKSDGKRAVAYIEKKRERDPYQR